MIVLEWLGADDTLESLRMALKRRRLPERHRPSPHREHLRRAREAFRRGLRKRHLP